ncbi:MAG: helix-turn-helix domain-containing protein [Myxococcota bacterium]
MPRAIQMRTLAPADDFRVFEVDATKVPPGFYPHRHDFYEVIWFHSGGGRNEIDFVPHPIRRNRVFLIAPGQVHDLHGGRSKSTFIAFGRGLLGVHPDGGLDLDTTLFRTAASEPFVDVAGQAAETLAHLLEMMRHEQLRDAPSWAMTQSLLCAFLLTIHRARQGGRSAAPPVLDDRVRRLVAKIDRNYLVHRSTSFYAKDVGLTPKRINELVRGAMGKTIAQLIGDRIILQAKRELRFTGRSVKEIAHALAYEDPAYFSRFFRRHTGMTPRAFRELGAPRR